MSHWRNMLFSLIVAVCILDKRTILSSKRTLCQSSLMLCSLVIPLALLLLYTQLLILGVPFFLYMFSGQALIAFVTRNLHILFSMVLICLHHVKHFSFFPFWLDSFSFNCFYLIYWFVFCHRFLHEHSKFFYGDLSHGNSKRIILSMGCGSCYLWSFLRESPSLVGWECIFFQLPADKLSHLCVHTDKQWGKIQWKRWFVMLKLL